MKSDKKLNNEQRSQSNSDELFKVIFLGFSDIAFRFDFSSSQYFSLFGTSWFLNLSFKLLFRLSLWISLGKNGQLSESEVWLILDQVLLVIISQNKSGWSVTTESGSESEKNEIFRIPSVFGWNQSLEISLRYVWFTFVINVQQ